eukprot:1760213-Pleurochrysis_carterae.AAC.1
MFARAAAEAGLVAGALAWVWVILIGLLLPILGTDSPSTVGPKCDLAKVSSQVSTALVLGRVVDNRSGHAGYRNLLKHPAGIQDMQST